MKELENLGEYNLSFSSKLGSCSMVVLGGAGYRPQLCGALRFYCEDVPVQENSHLSLITLAPEEITFHLIVDISRWPRPLRRLVKTNPD